MLTLLIIPGAFSVKAFEFRKFWGKKSEVRRFQDGSISESVVWSNGSATLAQKRMICRHIVTYLLNEKFDFPTDNGVIYVADQLDSLLERYMVRQHSLASYFNPVVLKGLCAAS
jgi:U3 small nucleolar RNA-associated protein 22